MRYVAASVVTDRQTDRQNERLPYPSRMRRGLTIEQLSLDDIKHGDKEYYYIPSSKLLFCGYEVIMMKPMV